jgi:hypothetical protein
MLMPNHLHALLTIADPEFDLGQVMQRFMGSLTASLNTVSGRSNRIFGGRYHWMLVGSSLYFAHALKYVYRNPVRAGLCERVEDYPFSTLNGLLGSSPLPFPIHFPFNLDGYLHIPERTEDMLEWLNSPSRPEVEEAIRKAYRSHQLTKPRAGWKRQFAEMAKDLGVDAPAPKKGSDPWCLTTVD